MRKTAAAERQNYFSVLLLLVDFCVLCHFPHFSDKACEMKGSQMKVCQFSGSTKMLDSCQKIMQGVCLLMCTCRKMTFLWCVSFAYTDSHGIYGMTKALGWFSRRTHNSFSEVKKKGRGRGRERGGERTKKKRETHTKRMGYFCHSCIL